MSEFDPHGDIPRLELAFRRYLDRIEEQSKEWEPKAHGACLCYALRLAEGLTELRKRANERSTESGSAVRRFENAFKAPDGVGVGKPYPRAAADAADIHGTAGDPDDAWREPL